MEKTIYLSGPITGTSYGEAVDWREDVRDKLLPGIKGLSPMRGKDYLASEKRIAVAYSAATPLSTADAIGMRDFYDCTHADAVLMYLPLSQKHDAHLSYGTLIEAGWASAVGIPIILVSDDPEVEHPILRKCIGLRVATLDEAVLVLNGMFGEYVAPLRPRPYFPVATRFNPLPDETLAGHIYAPGPNGAKEAA